MNDTATTSSSEPPSPSAFWAEFSKEEASWSAAGLREKVEAMNAFVGRRYPEIAFELIGQEHDEVLGLCVTAHGDIDAFPLVLELVRQAPAFERYRVEAFRSRSESASFAMVMNGFTLNTSDVLVGHWADGAHVGLEIRFACEIPADFEEHARRMAFILLDHIVGEYGFAVKVGAVEFVDAWSDAVQSPTSLDKFLPVFDSFWTRELGHTGAFPEGEGDWSILEIGDADDETEETAVVMVNLDVMSLAMRADLSYALTLTLPASDDDELEYAQEKQEQIAHMLEHPRTGVLAYTQFEADRRSAVYYVSDAAAARALIERNMESSGYELSGEYDFAWSKYCCFATA